MIVLEFVLFLMFFGALVVIAEEDRRYGGVERGALGLLLSLSFLFLGFNLIFFGVSLGEAAVSVFLSCVLAWVVHRTKGYGNADSIVLIAASLTLPRMLYGVLPAGIFTFLFAFFSFVPLALMSKNRGANTPFIPFLAVGYACAFLLSGLSGG